MNTKQRDYNASGLSIFLSYIKPHKKLFAVDMTFSLVVALIDLVFPYVSRWSMYQLLPDRLFQTFFIVMLIMFAAYLLKALFTYLVTVVGHGMGSRIEADIRSDLFGHMQSLSYSFFDQNRTGVLLARTTSDLFDIVELAHHGPENILVCGVTLIGAVIILLTINPTLTLVLVIMLPLCIGFCMWQRSNMHKANVRVKEKTGEISAAIESSVSGIRTAKAFANEESEFQKFREANQQYKNSRVSYYRAMGLFSGGIEATVGLMQVAVIAFGGFLIMNSRMDFIDLVTFALYVSAFTTPIRKLAILMEVYTQGSAGFHRFLELMRTEPEIVDAPDAQEMARAEGHIEYRHVSFSYQQEKEVLEDINIDIQPGETFALVGASGGGKTTICHLLPRFYDIEEGEICIDGINIKALTQKSLRRNIGIIQQDVFLFAGTILENIRYGRPDATEEEVVEAAKKAEIHEDILAMPDQYRSYVGERGVKLSGGQKQRISIARVFLKNPPILVLDEATSALDSVTEEKIQRSLDKLSENKTCIVIAHRLSTIRNADRIAVVEGKHIVESDTREELLARNGIYARLERAQGIL